MSHPLRPAAPCRPTAVRSVAFDLDGTLIDSEPIFHESGTRLLARRGKAFLPEVQREMMGTPARTALPLFRDRHGLAESVDDIREEFTTLFYEVLGETAVTILPGAIELLDRLEACGIPHAIVTSSGAAYVNRVLGPHDLIRRFGFILTCDDVRHGKPDPEIYLKAAEKFGHPPAEMLVLEDSPNGIKSAKAAGAVCVAVPHGLTPPDAVKIADAVVPSLADEVLWRLIGV